MWAMAFFLIAALITLIAIGYDYAEIDLLLRIEAGEMVFYNEIEENDSRQAIMGYVQTGIYIIMLIPFYIWIYRAHKNLPALNASHLRFTPGWAVGWFFVPVMNAFRPYQVMKEIWKASDPEVGIMDNTAWENAHPSYLIGWWWALLIIAGIVGRVGVYYWRGAEEISELLTGSYAVIASDILFIPAIVLVVLIIWNIDRRQNEKYEYITMHKPQLAKPSL